MPRRGLREAADWEKVALATENDRFKARYGMYFRRALYVTLVIAVVGFWCSPPIVIAPYEMPAEEIEVVEIPQSFDIATPARQLARPQVAIEAAPDTEVAVDVEIADTLPEDFRYVPSARAGAAAGSNFIAFDVKPEIRSWTPPIYPDAARQGGVEGIVLIRALVGADGRIQEAVVAQGVHPLLDEAALRAARSCVFRPGRQRDVPIPVWVTLPYTFTLP